MVLLFCIFFFADAYSVPHLDARFSFPFTHTYTNTFPFSAFWYHSNPHSQATLAQLSLLNTNSRFVYSAMGDYANAIVARMPRGSGLDSVFFVNSGSEVLYDATYHLILSDTVSARISSWICFQRK
jgi:hypothetical protein